MHVKIRDAIITAAILFSMPAMAQMSTQSGASAGAATGRHVGGSVGGFVGGVTGAAVGTAGGIVHAVTSPFRPHRRGRRVHGRHG